MMVESIQVIKHGVCIREFPSEHYSLNVMNAIVTIIDKETRRIAVVISPNTYDYIEIANQEIEDEQAD